MHLSQALTIAWAIITKTSIIEQILTLFRGQALDIHWTYNGICPSIEEYLEMVDASQSFLGIS